jgi:hypothetical protein
MKQQFYFTLCLITACTIANAQIKKGAILLGGDIGLAGSSNSPTTHSSGGKQTWIDVNTSFGKAVKDNMVVGFDLFYGYSGTSSPASTYNGNYKSNSFGAGVFLRRYQYLGSHFYFFGQGRLGSVYSTSTTTFPVNSTPYQNDTKDYGINLSFYPGISYAINDKWQLETGLPNLLAMTYVRGKSTNLITGNPPETSNYYVYSISSSLSNIYQLSVGMRLFFNR